MKDYTQMEIDVTLESDRDLKENMQAAAKFALGQIMEYTHPTEVKNRHEGYGIAAEGYSALQGKMKSVKTDMDDLLKLLPNGDGDVLNVIGSLYNSAVEVAVEAIKLAAQSYKIGSRQLSRADLKLLYDMKNDLTAQIAAQGESSLLDDTFVAVFEGR